MRQIIGKGCLMKDFYCNFRVYDVAVNNEEIFVLEGPRTIIRIAPNPDPYSEGKIDRVIQS